MSSWGACTLLHQAGYEVVFQMTIGDQPQAKRVFDLDSIQMLQMAKIMRDEGIFLSGRRIFAPPRLFLGAADNPFVEPFHFRPLRLAKKIAAGAEFIQTQFCFDIDRLRQHMEKVWALGLHEKCYILVGMGPLRSEKTAEFLQKRFRVCRFLGKLSKG